MNGFEVSFSQACLGKLSTNVRMTTFVPTDEKFIMRFVLDQDVLEDRWAIREIEEDFIALTMDSDAAREIIIEINPHELHFPHDGQQRVVYKRKERVIDAPID
jgi:hypothetical protein